MGSEGRTPRAEGSGKRACRNHLFCGYTGRDYTHITCSEGKARVACNLDDEMMRREEFRVGLGYDFRGCDGHFSEACLDILERCSKKK